MEDMIVACIQPRMSIMDSRAEFEAYARRFLRQAQAKAAQLVIFPELTGVMLAPLLISRFKLGFIKRADQANRPRAGFMARRLGRVSGAAAGALGGGFRGSLDRLLRKNSDALRDLYFETFGGLAQEFATAIVGGSLYLHDAETDTVRNRAYLFNADGEALGYQDKFHLAPDEQELATAGADLRVFQTRFGRLGVLIGRDILYPELARLLTIQGADLLVGIAAGPGAAQANVVRKAMAIRAEENQVFAAASFLLGPNYLGQDNRENFYGRSALLAPISLTGKGDGILVQVGTNHTEGLVAAALDLNALQELREASRFRPRQEMNLGNLGPVLAEMYQAGLTIEEAIERRIAGPPEPLDLLPAVEPAPEAVESGFQPVSLPEPPLEPAPSVAEALSLTGEEEAEGE